MLSYDELSDFFYYVDNFAARTIGQRELSKFYKKNRDKTIFDKVSAQLIAYSVLLSENMMGVWEEDCVVKETCHTKEAIEAYNRTAEQKYHVQKGTRIKKFHNGWTEDGRAYLKALIQDFKRVMTNGDFYGNLIDHWRTYASKHHRTHWKRTRPIESVEEAEEYDEADALLDLDIGDDDNFEDMGMPARDGGVDA